MILGMSRSSSRWIFAALAASVAACGCAPEDDSASADGGSSPGGGDTCSAESLPTLTEGKLTVATSEPAYEPWVTGDAPETGEGFEAAVAYAVAAELGYSDEDVEWARVPFEAAIQPGPKEFDFDINQFSITEQRRQAVDFSSPYYDVAQAVVALEGSPAASASSASDLTDVAFGVQAATTSHQAIEDTVGPSVDPRPYNNNDDVKSALVNGQVEAIVVDLPTAFYITSAEIDDAVIVGQLPATSDDAREQFGLVLDHGSELTDCVSAAVDTLQDNGTLADLEEEWLADTAGAPVLE